MWKETPLRSRWLRSDSLDAEGKICKNKTGFQHPGTKTEFKGRPVTTETLAGDSLFAVYQCSKRKSMQLSLPERPAAVLLQVVLGSFAVIRGQVQLCSHQTAFSHQL